MELSTIVVSATVFIGTVVIGITQFIKLIRDKNYTGAVVIAIAALIGGLVGAFDTQLGVSNITVAQGVLIGLGGSGVVTVAEKIG